MPQGSIPPPTFPFLLTDSHTKSRITINEWTLKTQIPLCRLYWSLLFGVVMQFCRFWISGQKQSVKLLQNMVQRTFQHPPPTVTLLLYIKLWILYRQWEGGEGKGGQREGTVEGQQYTTSKVQFLLPWVQQFTSWVENTNHEWMYLQSIKSIKQKAAKSVNRGGSHKAQFGENL